MKHCCIIFQLDSWTKSIFAYSNYGHPTRDQASRCFLELVEEQQRSREYSIAVFRYYRNSDDSEYDSLYEGYWIAIWTALSLSMVTRLNCLNELATGENILKVFYTLFAVVSTMISKYDS